MVKLRKTCNGGEHTEVKHKMKNQTLELEQGVVYDSLKNLKEIMRLSWDELLFLCVDYLELEALFKEHREVADIDDIILAVASDRKMSGVKPTIKRMKKKGDEHE